MLVVLGENTMGAISGGFWQEKCLINYQIKTALPLGIIEKRKMENKDLKEVNYLDKELKKGDISDIVTECYKRYGNSDTVVLLDKLKELGF